MRILFVFHNVYFFRYYDGVIRTLRAKGHEVIVSANLNMMTTGYTDRALRKCVEESGCREEPIILPEGRPMFGAVLRDIIGYSNYFRTGHPSPKWAAKWKKYLPKSAQKLIDLPIIGRLLQIRPIRKLLIRLEKRISPDRRVFDRLKNDPPDVVVACPFIWTLSADADYVKAAAQLNIPTVVGVASWDHLAGKGHFPLTPDVTLVWNKEMECEAVALQDIPAAKVMVTGAPPFDFWFDAAPTVERKAFLKQAGLPVDKPYVVFLCSSRPIAGENEPHVIKDMIDTFQKDESTKEIQILIRPYPSQAYVWESFSYQNSSIWPREGEWPDQDQARQNLFNTLYHSLAVIGINTTAMLEASVIGKPCLTIMTEEFKGSQTERAHFQHILRGGFMETATHYADVQSILADLLRGIDRKAAARKEFVRNFLRPRGLHYTAAEIAANAIEMAAKCVVQVQNSVSYAVCPFCASNEIYSCGPIDYPFPTLFADTQISLTQRAELWKCKDCESGFTQNVVKENDAIAFYSNKTSERWSSTEPFEDRRPAPVVNAIRDLLKPGMKVLDVGCSVGTFLDFASRQGCETYGLEYSESALAVAAAKGHICRKSIEDFDTNQKFDAVFFFDVVEHLYDVGKVFTQYTELIKPGGLLIVLTGDIHCANAEKHGKSWWYLRYCEHIMFPSTKYYSTLLPEYEMLAAHKVYALKWQDGSFGWKLNNIIRQKVQQDYHGIPSLSPDHILVVLRRR